MPDLTYRCDGSFEGLLCCVFESYEKKEVPSAVLPPDEAQVTLLPAKEIETDPVKAARVLASIPKRMGPRALDFVRRSFLTCLPDKETMIFRFLRIGYRVGPRVTDLLADETVAGLSRAVRHLNNESGLLEGFLRFSDFGGALVAEMEPKNLVLPLIARHFCERYPEERFLIFDRTHKMALIHRPGRSAIVPADDLSLPAPSDGERMYRELWRDYYDTIEVPGRRNERCRMSNMPKRYWKYMTEFSRGFQEEKKISSPAEGVLPGGKEKV